MILSQENAVLQAQTNSTVMVGAVGKIVLVQDLVPSPEKCRPCRLHNGEGITAARPTPSVRGLPQGPLRRHSA